jgi:hypothetical protein
MTNKDQNYINEKIASKIESNLINYNYFDKENSENLKFKSETQWQFKDGYIEAATRTFKIISLNLNNTAVALIGFSFSKNSIDIEFIQGTDKKIRTNRRTSVELKVPGNWHKLIMEALIISSFSDVFNKNNRSLNIIFSSNLNLEKAVKASTLNIVDKSIREERLKEIEYRMQTIGKIRDRYFNKKTGYLKLGTIFIAEVISKYKKIFISKYPIVKGHVINKKYIEPKKKNKTLKIRKHIK